MTTAERLAAYRDELAAQGFTREQAWDLVSLVAPSLHEDLEVKDDDAIGVGDLIVRFKPEIDTEELERIAEQVHDAIRSHCPEPDPDVPDEGGKGLG